MELMIYVFLIIYIYIKVTVYWISFEDFVGERMLENIVGMYFETL